MTNGDDVFLADVVAALPLPLPFAPAVAATLALPFVRFAAILSLAGGARDVAVAVDDDAGVATTAGTAGAAVAATGGTD